MEVLRAEDSLVRVIRSCVLARLPLFRGPSPSIRSSKASYNFMNERKLEVKMECDCNDPSCPKVGTEGELARHIEECTCADCHRYYSKI